LSNAKSILFRRERRFQHLWSVDLSKGSAFCKSPLLIERGAVYFRSPLDPAFIDFVLSQYPLLDMTQYVLSKVVSVSKDVESHELIVVLAP
jgi:hypothetical protein